jgi:hypothetical protein
MKFRDLSNAIGKNLIRLKPGEETRGVFRGDPVDFRQHWVNNRSSICTGRETCDLCKSGEKSSFRFRINFVVNENGAYVAKIFEQGKAVYEAMKALNHDYDLEKNQMKIKRLGSGTDTTYSILPVPNGVVTKDTEKAIGELALHQLSESAAEAAEEESGEGEHIPF